MTEKTLSKWEQAIGKLVEYTQDGKLEWEIVDPKEYLPNGDVNGAMLIVKYDNKHMLLCQKAYMRFSGNIFNAFSGTEVKDYRPELSVYDIKTNVIVYTFPQSKLTEDLYRAATYNASKVDELISNILGESSKDRT